MGTEEWSLIIQTVTALAIGFAGWQLLFHSRHMHRELETIYVQRYWQLMDRRSQQMVVDDKSNEEDRAFIVNYLRLCEDEIDLRRLGRVTDATWQFWAKAICHQASIPSYWKVFSERKDELPLLADLLKEGEKHDPLKKSWIARKLRGL